MKKKWPKLLIFVLAGIILVAGGVFLLRKEIVKAYYGEMESFFYSYGGGIAGDMREFSIVKEDGKFVFNAKGNGSDPFNVAKIVDKSTMSDIRDILAEQNLFFLNKVDEHQDDLVDGYYESLNVLFEKKSLQYQYYGTEQRKNIALNEYLMKLAEKTEKDYGELLIFEYHYGSYFGGEWNFSITKESNAYHFSALGRNGVDMSVEKEIDESVIEDLERIIDEQKLRLRDGDNIREKEVLDGWGESFLAEFAAGKIEFHYYGMEARRDEVLSKYLLELAGMPAG
jgi:hypothetical protein